MVKLVRDELFAGNDPGWGNALARLPHDIYHTPAYHQVPGFGRDGQSFVFVHEEGEQAFIWPYLLAPTDGAPGHHDVTSVYGYAGPLSSTDPDFVGRGWHALLDHWKMQGVVSAFTRFHPVLGNAELLRGLAGEGIRHCGSTVSIDLAVSPVEQLCGYQKVLRQQIRKSRERGFVTTVDEDWNHADDFVRHYRDTMLRRNSRREYLIDSEWLTEMRRLLGGHLRLFVTKSNDIVVAALLAMVYGPFVHAHLTGINAEFISESPLKVLLDDVRIWGTGRGLSSFHLGGGLGGREDTLFQFKRKFSPITHQFSTGSWILDSTTYRELEDMHRRRLAERGIEPGDTGFFPAYRFQPEPPALN